MTNANKMAGLLNTDPATTNASEHPSIPKLGPKFTAREARLLSALLHEPLMREAVDRISGASNGPQVVAGLRSKLVSIDCELLDQIDRDGRKCRPGRYSLTSHGRATLTGWGWA